MNDQVQIIPARSPRPAHVLICIWVGILIHNAVVAWLAKFSNISTKSKPIGIMPGFGLIKILRGREAS